MKNYPTLDELITAFKEDKIERLYGDKGVLQYKITKDCENINWIYYSELEEMVKFGEEFSKKFDKEWENFMWSIK